MRYFTFVLFAVALLAGSAGARVIHVPGEYPTIQQGIDAATGGDVVLVDAGSYPEEIALKAGVIVRGAGEGRSIIDGGGNSGDVVRAIGGAIQQDAKLEGFTVTGALNSGGMPGGGGLFCNSGASPEISRCRFEGNDVGVAVWNGSEPLVRNCVIVNNVYTGISTGAGATFINNTVHNCRIGFYDNSGYGPVLMNCVVTGCALYGVYGPSGGTPPSLTWNDVWGNGENYRQAAPGVGSISEDPLYADTAAGDFHLGSGSPCVDTGNPDPQYNDPDGSRCDMGAYGGPGAPVMRPLVIALEPGANATAAPRGTAVSATFSLDMDPASISPATFRLWSTTRGPVPGAVSYDSASRTARFVPAESLPSGEELTALLTRGVASLAGDSLGGYAWRFFVAAAGPAGWFPDTAPHATGSGPTGIVCADFDRDGDLDLVTANYSAGTVSWLRGLGDGTFAAPVATTTGSQAYAVCCGDFNSDSAPDLAVTRNGQGVIVVLLGNGDGSFQPAVTYATGSARGIACGDFDLDGDLDLVAALGSVDSVAVLDGLGNGTFAAARRFAVGDRPDGVAWGDFNNDGRPDLVAADLDGRDFAVLAGDGRGGFAAPVLVSTSGASLRVAAGDFTGDGNADLVGGWYDYDEVFYLPGDGRGGFGARVTFSTGGSPQDVMLFDASGDGALDIGAAQDIDGRFELLTGDGRGGILAFRSTAVGSDPVALAGGDFDGDGDVDIATASYGLSRVVVLLNRAALTVVERVPAQYATGAPGDSTVSAVLSAPVVPGTVGPTTVMLASEVSGPVAGAIGYDSAAARVSFTPGAGVNDGALWTMILTDSILTREGIALAGGTWQFTAGVGAATGGTFTGRRDFPAGTSTRGLAAADLDGDGDPDLALASCANYPAPGYFVVLRNNGDGTFAAPEQTALGYPDPISVACADLNRDGDVDAAVLHNMPGGSRLSILDNDGSGGFTLANSYQPVVLGQQVTAGDFDGDGDNDLVCTDGWGSADNVRVMFNNGSGSFPDGETWSAGAHARQPVVRDFDLDGDLDLAVVAGSDNNVTVLENVGNGTFPRAAAYPAGSGPNGVYGNDFNGDGRCDLAVTNSDGNVAVLLAAGPGFAPPAYYPAGGAQRLVAGGDYDGDGDIDLSCALSGDSVAVLANNGDGSFAAPVLYGADNYPAGTACADFDLDGDLDLATVNYNAGSVTIWYNDGQSGVAELPGTGAARFLSATPSLFRRAVRVSWAAGPDEARVAVFDAAGRRLARLGSGRTGSVEWDGRDELGRAVRPGVYFVRLDAGTRRLVQKVIRAD